MMADAFRVVVPALGRRTTGMLRPAVGARAGTLVVEDAEFHSPLARAICTEVELYLHAAGLHTLSLKLPTDVSFGARASRILGGVSVLRSLQCEKIVLITSSSSRDISQNKASAESASELLDLVARDARSVPEVIRVVRDLTATIRDVAESVVGVAALIERPRPARMGSALPHRTIPRILSTSLQPEKSAGREDTVEGPASLLLSLPVEEDAVPLPHALVQVVSQLYVWTLTLARPGASQEEIRAEARRLALETASTGLLDWEAEQWKRAEAARANWHARLQWADKQWEALLARAAVWHPARSLWAREAALPAGNDWGYSMRGARLSWHFLTMEERRVWLQVSSQVFRG